MPGPPYQQFQGYPNVVGNYSQGLDAGRDRAATQFSDRQTLETQNALLRQEQVAGSPVQSYPQLQAMQMQAKQQLSMYGPALQTAVENENYAMRDAIVETLRKTGNPMLGQFADIAATAKKHDKDQYGYDITFTTPEQRTAAYNADRYLQSVYPSAEAIQLNTPYRVSVTGMPGTPSSHTTKFEAVSRTAGKPTVGVTTVKSEAEIAALEEQWKDRPDIMGRLRQARLLLAQSPEGVDVSLPEAGGVKASKVSATANKPVAVSSEAQVRPLIMDLPPRIADEILRTVRDPANKGKVIYFETGSDGKLTGRVHKFGPAPSAGGFGSAWKLTPEENAALTKAIDEKRLNPNKVNSRTARVYAGMELEKPGMSFAGKAADIEADSKSLGNQQKIRDMMASFVSNMSAQIDRMGEITKDLSRTDTRLLNIPIRQLGMRAKGSAIESKVSMYLTEISNEIGKLSTGSAASVAELSLGAQKKWDKIHDPNLSIRDLMSLLKETQHAGNLRMKSVDDTISKTKGRLKGTAKDEDTPEYQTPPAGYKATGRKNAEGAPLYVSPSGKVVAAPKVQ